VSSAITPPFSEFFAPVSSPPTPLTSTVRPSLASLALASGGTAAPSAALALAVSPCESPTFSPPLARNPLPGVTPLETCAPTLFLALPRVVVVAFALRSSSRAARASSSSVLHPSPPSRASTSDHRSLDPTRHHHRFHASRRPASSSIAPRRSSPSLARGVARDNCWRVARRRTSRSPSPPPRPLDRPIASAPPSPRSRTPPSPSRRRSARRGARPRSREARRAPRDARRRIVRAAFASRPARAWTRIRARARGARSSTAPRRIARARATCAPPRVARWRRPRRCRFRSPKFPWPSRGDFGVSLFVRTRYARVINHNRESSRIVTPRMTIEIRVRIVRTRGVDALTRRCAGAGRCRRRDKNRRAPRARERRWPSMRATRRS